MTPDLAVQRRWIRRHRRPLSAGSAFLAVLALGLALRPPDAAPPSGPSVPAGFVELPTLLADDAIAGALAVGDVVDVVAQGPSPTIIASGAIVTGIPSGGAFSGAGAVVVLALPRAAGLAIAGAQGPLTVLRHAP